MKKEFPGHGNKFSRAWKFISIGKKQRFNLDLKI